MGVLQQEEERFDFIISSSGDNFIINLFDNCTYCFISNQTGRTVLVDNVGDVLLFLIKLSDEIIKNEIHLDIYLALFALFLIYYNKRIKMSF